ncbi:MAG: hypothetical protein MUF58_23215 [Arcicella sp.]|jgi:hypothetical protein|nr:hypothetical protein [Arcicella sp.]
MINIYTSIVFCSCTGLLFFSYKAIKRRRIKGFDDFIVYFFWYGIGGCILYPIIIFKATIGNEILNYLLSLITVFILNIFLLPLFKYLKTILDEFTTKSRNHIEEVKRESKAELIKSMSIPKDFFNYKNVFPKVINKNVNSFTHTNHYKSYNTDDFDDDDFDDDDFDDDGFDDDGFDDAFMFFQQHTKKSNSSQNKKKYPYDLLYIHSYYPINSDMFDSNSRELLNLKNGNSDTIHRYREKIRNKIGQKKFDFVVRVLGSQEIEVNLNQKKFPLDSICQFISEISSARYRPDILKKNKKNEPLKKMNKSDRENTIKGNYFISSKLNLNYKNVLIVDDIITTGTSLMEISRVLEKEYPFVQIQWFCIGKTE